MKGSVLVVNCGSSSIKFAVIAVDTGTLICEGVAERLLSDSPLLKVKSDQRKEYSEELGPSADHRVAMQSIVKTIEQQELQASIVAVGHRVVHGGEAFSESVIIDSKVIEAITAHQHLAPLHNPANLQGIMAAQTAFPGVPHIAVFDTAFHQSMPETAFLYALPYSLYREHGVRRYGFHGSSHRYVSNEAAKMLGVDINQCNVISAHLGNGCSVCAIQGGKSIDTSMGMTPLEGLVMGTRSGDLDPSLAQFLEEHLGYSASEINALYNKKSGLLGLSELSNDCRSLEQAAQEGNQQAQLALDLFCYRLAKYTASYMIAAHPLHALILTGGIGENSAYIREKLMQLLEPLGYKINQNNNERCRFGTAGQISLENTPKVLVIPTNEEWVIASDAARLAGNTLD